MTSTATVLGRFAPPGVDRPAVRAAARIAAEPLTPHAADDPPAPRASADRA